MTIAAEAQPHDHRCRGGDMTIARGGDMTIAAEEET